MLNALSIVRPESRRFESCLVKLLKTLNGMDLKNNNLPLDRFIKAAVSSSTDSIKKPILLSFNTAWL